MKSGAEEPAAPTAQRIDKWLWCARFFKTRTLAAKFVNDGNVRLTRLDETFRIDKPSFSVRPEDTIVFTRNGLLQIILVHDCAQRRGPAGEAAALYEDQSPPPPPKTERAETPFTREKGAGRPTKKQRRALEALKSEAT